MKKKILLLLASAFMIGQLTGCGEESSASVIINSQNSNYVSEAS
jgi:hypothetical protein